MSDKFDAKKEADQLEWVGNALLHGGLNVDMSSYADHLHNLSPLQAEALNEQLKWDNWKPVKMDGWVPRADEDPKVSLQFDKSGHIAGVSFTPAFFDTSAQAAFASFGCEPGKAEKK